MRFVSYPKHEFACPHLTCRPHAGGAALGTPVYAADEQTEWTDALQRQIDALRAENPAKHEKTQELTSRIEPLERELEAERKRQRQPGSGAFLCQRHAYQRHEGLGQAGGGRMGGDGAATQGESVESQGGDSG